MIAKFNLPNTGMVPKLSLGTRREIFCLIIDAIVHFTGDDPAKFSNANSAFSCLKPQEQSIFIFQSLRKNTKFIKVNLIRLRVLCLFYFYYNFIILVVISFVNNDVWIYSFSISIIWCSSTYFIT